MQYDVGLRYYDISATLITRNSFIQEKKSSPTLFTENARMDSKVSIICNFESLKLDSDHVTERQLSFKLCVGDS